MKTLLFSILFALLLALVICDVVKPTRTTVTEDSNIQINTEQRASPQTPLNFELPPQPAQTDNLQTDNVKTFNRKNSDENLGRKQGTFRKSSELKQARKVKKVKKNKSFDSSYSNIFHRPGYDNRDSWISSDQNKDRDYNRDYGKSLSNKWGDYNRDYGKSYNNKWDDYRYSDWSSFMNRLWHNVWDRDNYGYNRNYDQSSWGDMKDRFMDYFRADHPTKQISLSKFFRSDWIPSVEIKEDETNFVIALETPGLSKTDFKMYIEEDNVLVIDGQRLEQHQEMESHVSEIKYGRFLRSFKLPPEANAELLKAKLTNGILEITLPKKAVAEGKHRNISISDD